MGVVFAGDATPAQIGAFLTLLHAKGETVEEVTGLARAMVDGSRVACPLDVGPSPVVDLVGTGGDRLASINVTTLAALITAGCGVPVCKHGNRAASSSVGTADVLEALGVAVEIGPEGVARCVRRGRDRLLLRAALPSGHALRRSGSQRNRGPDGLQLPRPAHQSRPDPSSARRGERPRHGPDHGRGLRCHRQPAHPHRPRRRRPRRAQRDLADVGDRRARRCEGSGATRSSEWRVDPPPWGSRPRPWPTSRGGDAMFNAGVIRSVLEGEPGARRDIGLLNTSAALIVAGLAWRISGRA